MLDKNLSWFNFCRIELSLEEGRDDCFLNFKPGDGKTYPIELLSKINHDSLSVLLKLI